jgi:AmmeMemoRadiSam system protein B
MSRPSPMVLAVLLTATQSYAQAALPPAGPRPTLQEVRKGMGIASEGDVRGQLDIVGFASTAEQMTRVFELAGVPPIPEAIGPLPEPGVIGALCAHDDYLYAGRVDRRVLSLITAKTVILVGVFHKYRRFGAHDALVFDPYRAWRAPDGEVRVSGLREELLAGLPPEGYLQEAAMHDAEHSIEALVFWLRHRRPDLEIVPIIVPSTSFPRMEELAAQLGRTLAASMKRRDWKLGRDVAIVISADAVHYGDDFDYSPFGEGGIEAYTRAVDQDLGLLHGPLSGPVSAEKARRFFAACVDPEEPDEYRLTWCGRFSIPMGLLLLAETARALDLPAPVGVPVAYGTSVGGPELPVREVGMGETAPANLYHFVGLPGVAFTLPD